MKVLIACEFSGTVRDAFTAAGHEAWSCDLLPSETKGQHYQGDVLDLIRKDKGRGFDLMIAFPPCTHLSSSEAVYWPAKQKDGRQQQAIELVYALKDAPINHIAIENPVGILSRLWRKPDQIIHPYYFGTPELKKTCLWLKNLPKLIYDAGKEKPEPKGHCIKKNGERYNYYYHQAKSPKERSRFWPCIAKAMAEQWGAL